MTNIIQKIRQFWDERLKNFLLGNRSDYGLIVKVLLYLLLISIGFIYLYPLLFMFITSMKSPDDLLNSMIQWVPSQVYVGNYVKAFRVLNYPINLAITIGISVIPSLLQACVAALVGYGLARYRFRGKNLIFILLMATFIIPAQTTIIPQMLTYKSLGILGSVFAIFLPALFGQGLRSAIFILIFYQTFSTFPKALEEAARLDGASERQIFLKVALPTATPAFIVSIIFSIVWYWNETYVTSIFLAGKIQTLPLALSKFVQAYENLYPQGMINIADRLNEAVKLSGTFLNILPLLIMYFILQRWFVESVERSGITGE
ncbi:MAG: multiple sugar transport system permease protein [Erysipelotrichaceae bacterium]|nr:MAG: multiple sugar transport system permease [Erysipelotrichaceae bacterium]TXT19077.1 MAG: multiple sugar transport system permease protein [Erysipelotrichaceae bacterium]